MNGCIPRIIGHRGLRLDYPDNTLEGIEAAMDVCDMIELDVRRTRDGVAVLSHDPVVDGSILIETDWEDLRRLDVGRGCHLARLDDALDATAGYPLNIEIKNNPAEPDFDASFRFALAVADKASAGDVVSCFHWPTIDAVRRHYPDVVTGLLVDISDSLEKALDRAAGGGHPAVVPHWWLLGDDPRAMIGRLKGAGLQVVVWTVNDPQLAKAIADGGADGIITDDPAMIRAALEETQ